VKGLPVDRIEDRDVRPVMMSAKVNLVGRKTAQATDLSWDMMSDGDGTDLKAANTSRKEGDRGKWYSARSKKVSGDSVAAYIQLDRPREINKRNVLVLVAEDMMECNRSGEASQRRKDLHFDVGFRIQMTARVRVLKGTARLETLD
jgi:hypothetical protein